MSSIFSNMRVPARVGSSTLSSASSSVSLSSGDGSRGIFHIRRKFSFSESARRRKR